MSLLGSLHNILRTIRINDVVDILIMAFIIYKVLYFLARTGSGRVLRGVLLLVVVMLLANKLELYMINFIFGKTFELGVLALLIVFQPEVRSMLEKVGGITKYIQGRDRTKDVESAIGQVVLACTDLSETKTGALIVFERDNVLDEAIKTGTVINSETKSALLNIIFIKNTPLHDGAVIIRGGRIVATCCMLPMSSNTHLSRDLGMRHRAGIGVSETSDAVAVIVSEETGAISVAVEGTLKRHLTVDTLDKVLRNELLKDNEERQTRRPRLGFLKDRNNGKNKQNRSK